MSIGSNIRRFRLEKGLKQEDLAVAIGTTKAAISRYELDQREPKTEIIKRIADVLGVPGAAIQFDDPEHVSLTISDTPSLLKAMQAFDIWKYDGEFDSPLSEERAIKETIKDETIQTRILAAVDRLNYKGMSVAAERLEELAMIPQYQRQDGPQDAAPAPEGKDTTAAGTPTEGPQSVK